MKNYEQAFKDAKEFRQATPAKFHDLETTGISQSAKQPGGLIQMGTIKPIQSAFAEIPMGKDPEVVINDHVNVDTHTIISPVSSAVTGSDPNDHIDNPDNLTQLEFALKLSEDLGPIEILTGFNYLGYDREVARHSLHEQLCYPYPHSHMDCVYDIYLVLQAIYATDSNLINFPKKENGNVEMRQEKITKANGIEPKNAHTADGDVLSGGELEQFLWEHAPDHMTAAVMSGSKSRATERLVKDPFVVFAHVERFTRKGRVDVLSMLFDSGTNKYMTFDLTHDPSDYTDLDPTKIAKMLRKSSSPFTEVKISNHPIFLPAHYCKAAGISEAEAERRASKITESFIRNVELALSLLAQREWPVSLFPECRLYSDSFPKDLYLSNDFLNGTNEQRKLLLPQFNDPRAIEFAKRIIAIDQGSNEPEFYEEYMKMCRERFFDTSDTLPSLSYQGAIAQIDWLIEWGFDEEVVNPIGNYIEDMKEKLQ